MAGESSIEVLSRSFSRLYKYRLTYPIVSLRSSTGKFLNISKSRGLFIDNLANGQKDKNRVFYLTRNNEDVPLLEGGGGNIKVSKPRFG